MKILQIDSYKYNIVMNYHSYSPICFFFLNQPIILTKFEYKIHMIMIVSTEK